MDADLLRDAGELLAEHDVDEILDDMDFELRGSPLTPERLEDLAECLGKADEDIYMEYRSYGENDEEIVEKHITITLLQAAAGEAKNLVQALAANPDILQELRQRMLPVPPSQALFIARLYANGEFDGRVPALLVWPISKEMLEGGADAAESSQVELIGCPDPGSDHVGLSAHQKTEMLSWLEDHEGCWIVQDEPTWLKVLREEESQELLPLARQYGVLLVQEEDSSGALRWECNEALGRCSLQTDPFLLKDVLEQLEQPGMMVAPAPGL